MSAEQGRILVVDDEEPIRRFCEKVLSRLGFDVETVGDAAAALAALKERPADVLLTDLSMPGPMNGLGLVEEVRHRHPATDVVVMTAYPALDNAIPLLRSGAYDYLTKPFDPELLRSVVKRCFEKRRLSQELNRERLLRQELEAAYGELQKVERLKEAFLSRVNHELRTPLVPILMALDVMESKPEAALGSRFYELLRKNVLRMQSVIEDILVYTEIRREKFDFYRERVDLFPAIEGVVRKCRTRWEARGLVVEVGLDKDLEPVWASPRLLEKAFMHLLLNAIQFNKKSGSIRIRGWEEGDHVHLVFSDTGIGIPQDKISQIFDSFYQAAEYLTREVGGLGLGLALVRQIVELHGGGVSVESVPGQGSSFHVLLPKREPLVSRIVEGFAEGTPGPASRKA